jgi:putative oxidoreductase
MNVVTTLDAWSPRILSLVRFVTGLLFIEHGTAKFFGIPYTPSFAKLQWLSMPGVAGLIELIGGALLILGLWTRPVAFILSGEMAVAYWIAHAPGHWAPLVNRGELAALYCFIFFLFIFTGGGPYSMDALFNKKR